MTNEKLLSSKSQDERSINVQTNVYDQITKGMYSKVYANEICLVFELERFANNIVL